MSSADCERKDSYDRVLEFSRITRENWFLPDNRDYLPFDVSKEEWAVPFLEPVMGAAVPLDVRRAFETARGCIIYSWFFYPLATLGSEQCTRVAEAAARERCRVLGRASENFADNLETLVERGIASGDDEVRWQALRRLRNDRSHLNGYMLVDHGEAVDFLRSTAELVNTLFAPPGNAAA